MGHLVRLVFEPGVFSNHPVRIAVLVGGVVALLSAAVGIFTVIRGQSFAGEAMSDVGATGGSAAYLIGISPIWGFVGMGIVAAGVMEMFGIRRPRGRDLATGIVLGAALGLAALFLYWDTTLQNTTGATITILFGSIFVITPAEVPAIIVLSLVSLGIFFVLYRQLLLTSMSVDLASARGVPVRIVGVLYLLALAVAVSLSCLTIGAILSTALLIGPAATALRMTKRPGVAMLAAGVIGVTATWLGILLAYDSFYWAPRGRVWPVSFFVVTLVVIFYLAADVPARRRSSRRQARAGMAGAPGRRAAPVGAPSPGPGGR
jgi:zinc/manganese transport system permease protein